MQRKQEQRLSSSFQEDYFLYLTMAVGGLPLTGPAQGQTLTDRQTDTAGTKPAQGVNTSVGAEAVTAS